MGRRRLAKSLSSGVVKSKLSFLLLFTVQERRTLGSFAVVETKWNSHASMCVTVLGPNCVSSVDCAGSNSPSLFKHLEQIQKQPKSCTSPTIFPAKLKFARQFQFLNFSFACRKVIYFSHEFEGLNKNVIIFGLRQNRV